MGVHNRYVLACFKIKGIKVVWVVWWLARAFGFEFSSCAIQLIKVSYSSQKGKWTLDKLISYCVQEEESLKQKRTRNTYLASTFKDKLKDNEVALGLA